MKRFEVVKPHISRTTWPKFQEKDVIQEEGETNRKRSKQIKRQKGQIKSQDLSSPENDCGDPSSELSDLVVGMDKEGFVAGSSNICKRKRLQTIPATFGYESDNTSVAPLESTRFKIIEILSIKHTMEKGNFQTLFGMLSPYNYRIRIMYNLLQKAGLSPSCRRLIPPNRRRMNSKMFLEEKGFMHILQVEWEFHLWLEVKSTDWMIMAEDRANWQRDLCCSNHQKNRISYFHLNHS